VSYHSNTNICYGETTKQLSPKPISKSSPLPIFSLYSSNPNIPKLTTQFGIGATDPTLGLHLGVHERMELVNYMGVERNGMKLNEPKQSCLDV
jgi:hypothetical protein